MIAAAILVTFLVFEIGLRVYEGIPVLRLTNFIADQVDRLSVVTHIDYDERLGWVGKPSASARHFNTGAYGIRLAGTVDRPIPQEAILAVGDSFTFGEEVEDDETWPADLEAITGTPVINAATSGWGTDQIVMRAEAMLDIAHPKVLILGFFWQDIGRAELEINFGAPKPYFTVEAGKVVLHNVPVPRFAGTVRELGFARTLLGYSYAVFWLAQQLGFQEWLYAGHATFKRATPPGSGEKITCLLLQELKEKAGPDIRLMLVMQYGFQDFAGDPPLAATHVLACAQGLGVATVDTWTSLARIHVADPVRLRSLYMTHQQVVTHMSPAGNRLIAAEIARELQAGN